jgi:hypothetical protein
MAFAAQNAAKSNNDQRGGCRQLLTLMESPFAEIQKADEKTDQDDS